MSTSKEKNIRLLAIDTSTDCLSVAVMENARCLRRFHRRIGRNHSRLLVSVIETLLRRSATRLDQLDGFAVSVGPGSFTGLRIGVTTVQALAFCSGKKIVTVSAMDAIARGIETTLRADGAESYEYVCPMTDARKTKVYAALFRVRGSTLERVSDDLLLPLDHLFGIMKGRVLFLGNGAAAYRDDIARNVPLAGFCGDTDWYPRAVHVGTLGLEKFRKKDFTPVHDLVPRYLYSKECDITGF
ncbi:MAG: tRNA (adenosine(37)-N6)-threonylcarbamoyltransferase complex dimerization subunit type 1 TsaB [Candidatus Omnitrophota bacterium]